MNQNTEQQARHRIDDQLTASEWILQDKTSFNLAVDIGAAIREFQNSVGSDDYVLFVNRKPLGLFEAKREEGVRLTMVEDHSTEYASAKLKYIKSNSLQFVYESTTSGLTRFMDYCDAKPRSLPVLTFHRSQTFEGQRQIVQEIESRLSVCDKTEETVTDTLKQAEALRQNILMNAFECKLL